MEGIEKININDVTVLAVELARSTLLETKKFRALIDEEINQNHLNLVVDLSKCDHIDSTFLGGIMMALQKLNGHGGKMKIVEPSNPNEDIFDVTKTHELFDMYKTREAAIKSFALTT